MRALLFALAASLGLAFAGCTGGGPGTPAGRGLLVVVIDGLRADHVGSAGYDRDTTPELDRLAREGVSFSQAFSNAPSLLPAHIALLTGCDARIARRPLPPDVPVSVMTAWHMPEGTPHVAFEFSKVGFETAAFVDHGAIAPVYGLKRGFQRYSTPADTGIRSPADLGLCGARQRFEQWVRQRGRAKDWFAYLEADDLHRAWNQSDPSTETYFEPREELSRVPPVGNAQRLYFAVPKPRWSGGVRTLGELESRYDGAIHRVDVELGKLCDELRRLGRYETTTIVVTSGHGLGFGEAGLYLDHGTLTDVDLHVPLVVKPAAGTVFERGLVTPALASLQDVAPTLLELAHIPKPGAMQGVSFAEALRGGASQRPFAFARCGYQEGVVVFDERYCFESTSPWITEDRNLVTSWYGGAPPPDRAVREVLHDRRTDPTLGHESSLSLDDPRVEAMRQAAAIDGREVERLRFALHGVEWLDATAAPAAPAR